jgi:EAL domain-containing protein (putative c-di-GMP-specific phosphodiesterase class I)
MQETFEMLALAVEITESDMCSNQNGNLIRFCAAIRKHSLKMFFFIELWA